MPMVGSRCWHHDGFGNLRVWQTPVLPRVTSASAHIHMNCEVGLRDLDIRGEARAGVGGQGMVPSKQ
jgi:hypothetical protein